MTDQAATTLLPHWGPALTSLALLFAAALAGLLVDALIFWLLGRAARRAADGARQLVVRRLHGPSRLALPGMGMLLALPSLALSRPLGGLLRHGLSIAVILAFAWLLARAVHLAREVLAQRLTAEPGAAGDPGRGARARRLLTQTAVLEKVLLVIIVLIALASVLMTFDRVRQIGVSVLASAGILGIVLGVAAQRTLGSLLAGIQLALTQPLHLDDLVVVEGEQGRVEAINLTHVVIRLWDLRRLVVPITWFVEKPFQNWTHSSAELHGTVLLRADYTVDVEALRGELRRILAASPEWDGETMRLQVSDAGENTVELRVLLGAADAAALWELRCRVREQLIEHLRRTQPGALPRPRPAPPPPPPPSA